MNFEWNNMVIGLNLKVIKHTFSIPFEVDNGWLSYRNLG